MVTGPDRIHCTWCGALITGGRRFCAGCGKPVVQDDEDDEDFEEPLTAIDAEPEQSPGLLGTLFGGLAAVVVILLVLIMVIVSTALPILVVVALLMGPGDTWDMVKQWVPGGGNDNPTCEGFDDWYEESADRTQRILRMLDDYQSDASADPASLRSYATEADAMAAEQRRSDPPQEAVVLNGIMVETLENWAGTLRAVADVDQAAYQTYLYEAEQLTPVFNAEEERVFDVCR